MILCWLLHFCYIRKPALRRSPKYRRLEYVDQQEDDQLHVEDWQQRHHGLGQDDRLCPSLIAASAPTKNTHLPPCSACKILMSRRIMRF